MGSAETEGVMRKSDSSRKIEMKRCAYELVDMSEHHTPWAVVGLDQKAIEVDRILVDRGRGHKRDPRRRLLTKREEGECVPSCH